MAVISSCSDKKWTAQGTIANGDGKTMLLEAPNGHGGWYPADTIEIGRNGSFTVKGEPAGHPEVYRLTLDGQSLYFPIDSLESVSIESDANAFATDYIVSGSESADKMQQINSLIDKVVKHDGEQAVAYDRPTPLRGGEQGLRNWMRQFFAADLGTMPERRQEALLERVEELTRPRLWNGSVWMADYRRLRVVARS